MESNLIDYPDQWDAVQIVETAIYQVWDETLAVLVPALDSRRDVIPNMAADAVLETPAYQMLHRIGERIRQQCGC
jgi:hypothetical protein